MSALVVAAAAGTPAAIAQTAVLPGRLTVNPQKMARGTRTEHAGEQQLDGFASGRWASPAGVPTLYVPEQCVGARRCPLVVFMWSPWSAVIWWMRPMADKYGMIVLDPVISSGNTADIMKLDAELQHVLWKYAIDPGKIAIMGTCATGPASQRVGGENMHVFSRVISLSSGLNYPGGVSPPNYTTEFFIDAGSLESRYEFVAAQELRRRGHRVTHAFGFRQHGHQWESYDAVGRWLQTTWATPNPAARPRPQVVADPLPLLTTDVLAQMTAFWTRFLQEPDSIRITARQAHLREVVVPVGDERPEVVMVDIPALAGKYPSVAAALQDAGLTPQQHEAYRVALASARVANNIGRVAGTVKATSVVGKNIAFMNAHPEEFQALEKVGPKWMNMWTTP